MSVKAPQGNNQMPSGTPDDIELIYQRYLQAFKKGVYNYIKEEPDPLTHGLTPRKYFSGGVVGKFDAASISYTKELLPQEISALPGDAAQVTVNLGDYDAQVEMKKYLMPYAERFLKFWNGLDWNNLDLNWDVYSKLNKAEGAFRYGLESGRVPSWTTEPRVVPTNDPNVSLIDVREGYGVKKVLDGKQKIAVGSADHINCTSYILLGLNGENQKVLLHGHFSHTQKYQKKTIDNQLIDFIGLKAGDLHDVKLLLSPRGVKDKLEAQRVKQILGNRFKSVAIFYRNGYLSAISSQDGVGLLTALTIDNKKIENDNFRVFSWGDLRTGVVDLDSIVSRSYRDHAMNSPGFVKTDLPFAQWAEGLFQQKLDDGSRAILRHHDALIKGLLLDNEITRFQRLMRDTAKRVNAIPSGVINNNSDDDWDAWHELVAGYQQMTQELKEPMFNGIPNVLRNMLDNSGYQYLSQELAGAILDRLRLRHLRYETTVPYSLMSLNPHLSYYREYVDLSGSRIAKVIFFTATKESKMEITEFFFVDGEYVGYGHAKLTSQRLDFFKQNKLDNLRLLFHILNNSRGNGELWRRVFDERMKEFSALLPKNGRFEIRPDQFNQEAAALKFYADLGFKPEDPQLEQVMRSCLEELDDAKKKNNGKINPKIYQKIVKDSKYNGLFSSILVRYVNDKAQISLQSPGGIDLTDKRMKLDVDSDKAAVSQSIDWKVLGNIEIDGLYIKDIERSSRCIICPKY
jgi:hypothetical protein